MGLRSASSATHAYLLHFPFFLDKTVGDDSLSYNGFKFGTFDKHHAAPKCVSKSGGSWGYDGWAFKSQCWIGKDLLGKPRSQN